MNKYLNQLILVDDEELLLKSLKRELLPWAESKRVEILTFISGYKALDYLKENHSNVFLIISDLRMPVISGPDFLIEVNSLYPIIKLFLLTAFSEIHGIQSAIKASINRLILKPWDSVSLQTDIENTYNTYKTEQQNRELKYELEQNIQLAADFQRKLLPEINSYSKVIQTDLIYKPNDKLKCAGDYYDFCDLDKHRQLILIGDVSGHGIKPAFVTAMLKVLCSMYKPNIYNREISPGEIVSFMNDGLYRSLGDIRDIISTLTIVLIDHKNKKMTYSGAGQLPIYILREDKLISLDNDNLVMGFIHDVEYKDKTEVLEKGDLIIMFTDGLIESEKSRTIMDKNRIRSLLLTLDLTTLPAEKILNTFKKSMANNEFADDVTLITSRIL